MSEPQSTDILYEYNVFGMKNEVCRIRNVINRFERHVKPAFATNIVVLVETKIEDTVDKNELKIDGFEPYHVHSHNALTGGESIYTRKSMNWHVHGFKQHRSDKHDTLNGVMIDDLQLCIFATARRQRRFINS